MLLPRGPSLIIDLGGFDQFCIKPFPRHNGRVLNALGQRKVGHAAHLLTAQFQRGDIKRQLQIQPQTRAMTNAALSPLARTAG